MYYFVYILLLSLVKVAITSGKSSVSSIQLKLPRTDVIDVLYTFRTKKLIHHFHRKYTTV